VEFGVRECESNFSQNPGISVIYVIGLFYVFFALSHVVKYFLQSLHVICEKLHLSEDVAGATFLAAGTSIPELLAALIDTFITKSGVGAGTVIGSVIFNIFCMIGGSCLIAPRVLPLDWRPLARDLGFWGLTIIVLISVLADNIVTWVESMIFIIFYACYVTWMVANPKILIFMNRLTPYLGKYANRPIESNNEQQNNFHSMSNEDEIQENGNTNQSESVDEDEVTVDINGEQIVESKHPVIQLDDITEVTDETQEISLDDQKEEIKEKTTTGEFKFFDSTREFAETTKRRAQELGEKTREKAKELQEKTKEKAHELKDKATKTAKEAELLALELVDEAHQDMHSVQSPFEWPKTNRKRAWHVIGFPVYIVCYFTIPNLNSYGKQWWPLSIFVSLSWITGFVYLMVELANAMGCILGVHPVVMGLTILAVGTSFPDFISSIYAAKAGSGDMALANCLGSNIFDVLLCLGLPWFLSSVTSLGTPIHLHEELTGLFVWLALSWAFAVAALWRLQFERRPGILLLVAFGVWVLYVFLHSYNVIPF